MEQTKKSKLCKVEKLYIHKFIHKLYERNLGDELEEEFFNFKHILKECKQHKLSIVFGNLGRHVNLLTMYLDLVLDYDTEIGIISKWNVESPYVVRDDLEYKILFLVEPDFGTLLHQTNFKTKSTIVLTSHLNLPKTENIPKYFYNFGENWYRNRKFETISNSVVEFVPPVFYDYKWKIPLDWIENERIICLDLSKCLTAYDAYLRYLTGKEMTLPLCYTFQIPKHIFQELETLIPRDEMFEIVKNKEMRKLYFNDFLQNE